MRTWKMIPEIVISQSTLEDLPTIFEFYAHAVALQKRVSDQHWQGFDQDRVKAEVEDNRQYKILVNGQIACVFLVSFNDPEIWGERDKTPSIYLHRIVTHPNFRGYGFVKHITNWALELSRNSGLQFVRMDTWANNEKLVSYYKGFGFADAGTIAIGPQSGLPKHYEGITLQLFEIEVAST